VTEGFEETLHARKPQTPPRARILDGEQEAKILALRLAKPPKGLPTGRSACWPTRSSSWGSWRKSATRPYARRLEKRHDAAQDPVLGHPARGERRICSGHGERAGNLWPAVQRTVSGVDNG
jgi:hypothetical protein